ncbi:tyrosine-protein phosphatase [Actinomadura rupiterrae]|uniref:tyrosine-protein phosphatase n=1 Tax=Actinomadura rupiterrae TaxID=559627 RepID=UPI0020A5F7D8|nr:tyrosine-protein phosphatase [Actinomadura rupiterrae]MCP2343279.1 protein-tyrosine phosphatase [Actinomadura rupiterrae]
MRRHIAFERLYNFRDLGGYRGDGGRTVGWERLYRSDSLGKLVPGTADWDRFLGLGVTTVIDLRYPWEIERRGRVPHYDGLDYHNLSIEHRPYDQAEIDPGADPWRYLAGKFAEVAEDGVKELAAVLEVVAAAEGPVAFHCAAGKDRTGMVAALLLSLAGVDEADILADFALTELATDRFVADWRADNPGRELRWPGYGRAPADVMRHFLTDLTGRYGSVQGYVGDRLGVGDEVTARLRERILQG